MERGRPGRRLQRGLYHRRRNYPGRGAATGHTGVNYTLTGANDSLPYVIGVQAVNPAGVSAWVNSNEVPAAPPDDGASTQ